MSVESRLDRIEQRLDRNNDLLAEHMKRTELLERDVSENKKHRSDVLDIVIKQSEKARLDQMKLIKISLGLFAAISILVTALAKWM